MVLYGKVWLPNQNLGLGYPKVKKKNILYLKLVFSKFPSYPNPNPNPRFFG